MNMCMCAHGVYLVKVKMKVKELELTWLSHQDGVFYSQKCFGDCQLERHSLKLFSMCGMSQSSSWRATRKEYRR